MSSGHRKHSYLFARLAGIAASLAFACVWANPPAVQQTSADSHSAVWSPKELTFQYQGFTTKYSCDGLRQKMRKILLELGARADLDVRSYGCTRLTGPDPFAGVTIRMSVLQLAAPQDAPKVPVRWKAVDVLADREAFDAAADCELIGQIRQKILPLFTTRNVDYSATCARHLPVIGSTRLKADVLAPDDGGAAPSASR